MCFAVFQIEQSSILFTHITIYRNNIDRNNSTKIQIHKLRFIKIVDHIFYRITFFFQSFFFQKFEQKRFEFCHRKLQYARHCDQSNRFYV